MEQRSIVAIEIGSSKLKGAVASVDSSGAMTILAVEEIPATNNVRHGRVQNVTEVSSGLNELIRKLENNPAVSPRKISAAALPLGGRSLASISASASLQINKEIEIVDETVSRLKKEAVRDVVTNKNIEAIIPRNFWVNNVQAKNPVGIFGRNLRAEFTLMACSNENRRNLERLKIDGIEAAGIRYFLRPLAIGELVLTQTERQLGCALVDFGAETTTVSIYKGDALCFLSTLPLGSRLITRDLVAGLNITEERAEAFKTGHGDAIASESDDTDANSREINAYVHARAGEIAANIINQIVLSGYKTADLPEGIILVGGGARLRNFGALLAAQGKIQVRAAALPPTLQFRSAVERSAANIDVVALLAAAAAAGMPECTYIPAPVEAAGRTHHEALGIDDSNGGTAAADSDFEARRAAMLGRKRSDKFSDDDDDDNLLGDDPDIDENADDDSSETKRRKDRGGRRFPWFHRSKNRDDEEEPEEEEDVEEEYPDDGGDDGGDDGNGGEGERPMGGLIGRLARLLTIPEEEDDDEDDDYRRR